MKKIKGIKEKSFGKKSGAALAYVIVTSALLLVIASALISVAAYNLKISAKSADSRQTYITARSAVEFAKGEIYERAGDSASQISIGNPSDRFYIKKGGPNDFSIESVTPTSKEYAGECEFVLKKATTTTKRTTKVWIDGVQITEYPADGSIWSAADNEQTQIRTKEYVNGVLTSETTIPPTFKAFPADVVELTSEVMTQITDDTYTQFTYDTSVVATVEFNNSTREQIVSYDCETVPGYTRTATTNPPIVRPANTNGEVSYVVAGAQYGENVVMGGHYDNATSWIDAIDDAVASDYPVSISRAFFLNSMKNAKLTAPELYFMEINDALFGYGFEMELSAGFIYLNGNISGKITDPKKLIIDGNGKKGVILLSGEGGNVKIVNCYNAATGNYNATISIPNGYYFFKDGTDLMKLSTVVTDSNYYKNFLTKTNEETLKKSPYKMSFATKDYVETNYQKKISGDEWVFNGGCHWTYRGEIAKNGAKPSYIIYNEKIDWHEVGRPYEHNMTTGDYKYSFDKVVGFYINDLSDWEDVLHGDAGTYKIIENIYQAAAITMQYVSQSKENFIVPANKTVVFQADTITLSTQYDDGKDNNGVARPTITHEGDAAAFVMQGEDGIGAYSLIIPHKTKVAYVDKVTGSTESYTIEPGTYEMTEKIDLFSAEAEVLLQDPSGGSGGGGSGGTPPETDPPGVVTNPKDASFTNGVFTK